jgi:hypothetical protein
MNTRILAIVSGLVLMAGVGLTAQRTSVRLVPPTPPGMRLIEAWRPANTGSDTKIIGSVLDIRHVPVSYARVQLRNLSVGIVAQQGQANGEGRYEFLVDDPGTYVVEMIHLNGYVIALSNAGSLARYETLQTLILLPGRWDAAAGALRYAQHPTNFLGMSAATTMSAATMSIAVDENVTPVDAGEPVSPIRP